MAYKFVNPYNFIPLDKKVPSRSSVVKNDLSGVIEYSVLTKTPLIIPNTSNDHAFLIGDSNHHSYDFFSYVDLSKQHDAKNKYHKPVIPGSEVRGMIRSNYEIITNSCLSALDSDEIMSKRVREVLKAGLLKKTDGGYELYRAEDCIFRAVTPNSLYDAKYEGNYRSNTRSFEQKTLKEGQEVNFEKIKRQNCKPLAKKINQNQETIGYVIKGERGLRKHNLHIFVPTEKRICKSIKLDILEQVLKVFNKTSESYEEYSMQFEIFKSGEGCQFFPVYYSDLNVEGTKKVFLSPGSILSEIVGDHKTCDDIGCLCPACRLFGTVINKNNKNYSVSSRVRFSDLTLMDDIENLEKLFEKPITLAPLSSPKLNNMEFYLKRPNNAIFWTYDYYIDDSGKVYRNDAGINGRKFYWHSMKINDVSETPSKLNATMRPLKKDVRFSGKIYFSNLTQEELDRLVYVVNCGECGDISEKKHGYKLGHAKPLGYGSIAIKTDRVQLRKIVLDEDDASIDYRMTEYISKDAVIGEEIRKNFEVMTNFEATKDMIVDYPRTEDGGKIYEWFVNNRGGKAMRNERKEEGYEKYLYPLEINMRSTGFKPKVRNWNGSKGSNNKFKPYGKKR